MQIRIGPRAAGPSRPSARFLAGQFAVGFSLTELLVSIAIIALLAGIMLGVVARTRVAAQSVNCVSRLHHIGTAFTQYAADNDGFLPDPGELQQSWEKCLRGYLSDSSAYQCPADEEVFPVVGSSYDWRDTGVAATTLAGRPLVDVNRGGVVLAFESLPGWHARHKMNAAFLDGSARTMTDEACLSDLQSPIRGRR
ncbi:MAG TPA: type II secretion system protein [Tepidisphaeraceae bacterium]|nr:type II secretion system protein [Tepidisphaeraceae bacterium]